MAVTISKALELGMVYSPVFNWEGNDIIFGTPKHMFETEAEAIASFAQVGLDLMVFAGASFTGRAHIVTTADEQLGLAAECSLGKLVFLSGPVYDRAKAEGPESARDAITNLFNQIGYEDEN